MGFAIDMRYDLTDFEIRHLASYDQQMQLLAQQKQGAMKAILALRGIDPPAGTEVKFTATEIVVGNEEN
jgi:hypothetical protein